MCLGIPGRIESIADGELRTARVSFGGIIKEVCLAYTPEAKIGEYVVVHAGFAISVIDEAETEKVFSYLEEIGAVSEELGEPDDEISR